MGQPASGVDRAKAMSYIRQPFDGESLSEKGIDAGWSSPVARQAHNLKVTGSNPVPATKNAVRSMTWRRFLLDLLASLRLEISKRAIRAVSQNGDGGTGLDLKRNIDIGLESPINQLAS